MMRNLIPALSVSYYIHLLVGLFTVHSTTRELRWLDGY